jgi:hypothetical protein
MSTSDIHIQVCPIAPSLTLRALIISTGPDIPVGDWVDPTVNGNGKGFPRLVEPPAVKPASRKPRNNVNVISLSYIPEGVSIHYQTPFGLGTTPLVKWGTSSWFLWNKAHGTTVT